MYNRKEIRNIIFDFDNKDFDFYENHVVLGKGSSRIVCGLGEEYVIKISYNTLSKYFSYSEEKRQCNNGIQQSLKEIRVWKECPSELRYLLNPIVEYGVCEGHVYIIQKKVTILEDVLPEVFCLKEAYQEFGQEEEYDYLEEDILDLCAAFDLHEGDMLNAPSNVGFNNESNFTIVDYGYIGI